VAELAYWLTHWLQSPEAGARDLTLDSMSTDPGLIHIVWTDSGWSVGTPPAECADVSRHLGSHGGQDQEVRALRTRKRRRAGIALASIPEP
jgi:hypothetical protein